MFSSLKIIELASVLAGPGVGQFFAELGAEVIKVENSAVGDVTRSWKSKDENTDDRSAYFCSVNWGKKSITIDLTTPSGKDSIYQLVRQADILIASYKPGDAHKLGVSYDQLKHLNKKLIYGQITGYGSESDRVGYDAIVQAEAGFMDLNGEPAGAPLKMPVALIDILAGHHLKQSLLISLLHRERTGEGSFTEVSLIQAGVASLANQATNWLVGRKLPTRQGSAHPNIAPYGEFYTTADSKFVMIAVGTDRQFNDLCTLLQIPLVATQPQYITNRKRVENRTQLYHILADRISTIYANDFIKKAAALKVPVGIVQNIQEVFEMPLSQSILIKSNDLKGVRTFIASNTIQPWLEISEPPHIGQHTNEIL